MSDIVLLEVEAPVARITINRPEKRNALNGVVVQALLDAISVAEKDASVRVIVLTGAGKVFSSGADLAALQALQTATTAQNLADSRLLASLLRKIHLCPKPVVARVNGHAIAGGTGLVTACDLAIAVEDAKLGFTEVRIGFVPAVIMPFVLRKLRPADARALFLKGGLVDARGAERVGLVYEAVSVDELDARVDQLVSELATKTSGSAIAMTKMMLAHVPSLNLDAALDYAAHMNALARSTPDCQQGILSFLAKKPMPWAQE